MWSQYSNFLTLLRIRCPALPAYLNVGVKFEVGLKIIPIISGPGVFDPKLRRTDALICALETWIVLGSDKTKL